MFDVIARKLVWIQIWLVENLGRIFESTLLQELEWHVHTALFALVLGYGYIWNTHVRVDLVRETLAFRKKAWLELLGLTFFMIPYCLIVIYFASVYAYDSFMIHEISASQVGLTQPLDHQERPGVRPDRRRCSLASPCGCRWRSCCGDRRTSGSR